MATYAIGDIQACHRELMALLDLIKFSPGTDRLWFTGDLVNRGPDSLAVLRTVASLDKHVVVVLGNHDLHLLGCAYAERVMPRRKDTIADVLTAPDREELLTWLRRQPLLHHDADLGYTLIHSGLPPQWDLTTASACALEVSGALQAADFANYLEAMYGDLPDRWDPALRGPARLRFITNCLARMRYCDASGRLELSQKGQPGQTDARLLPWYAVPGRASENQRIVFGHWSSLRMTAAERERHRVYPLDTGAVWGGELTAMRLEDGALFQVKSSTTVAFD